MAKKQQYGLKEQAIIEQELEKLLRRSTTSQDPLDAEDIAALEKLMKAKKLVFEREDIQDDPPPKDVTNSLSSNELLAIAEGEDETH